MKARISALYEYSLLSENEYPTYGITKRDIKSINLKNERIAIDEKYGCVVIELGYWTRHI